jgi:chromosome segregation ATPase
MPESVVPNVVRETARALGWNETLSVTPLTWLAFRARRHNKAQKRAEELEAKLKEVERERDTLKANCDEARRKWNEMDSEDRRWARKCTARAEAAETLLSTITALLRRISDEGPIERFGANTPERCVQWIRAVRQEAGEACKNGVD